MPTKLKPKIAPRARKKAPAVSKVVIETPIDIPSPRFNKHLMMGYVFLFLVFMGAVSSVYYWEYKAKIGIDHSDGYVSSGEQSSYSTTNKMNDPNMPDILNAQPCPPGYSKTGINPKTKLPEPAGGLEQCELID